VIRRLWQRCVIAIGIAALAVTGCAAKMSADYADKLKTISNRIFEYNGQGRDLPEVREDIVSLMRAQPRLPHAYAEAAHFLLFVNSKPFPDAPASALEAIAQYLDTAAKLDESYCPAYWLRGQLLIVQKKPDEAIAAIRQAQALGCKELWQNVVLARAAMLQQQGEPAVAALQPMIDAGPGATSAERSAYGAALDELSKAYLATGDIANLRKLLATWDQHADLFNPWTRMNEASMWILIGDFDRGLQTAKQSLVLMDFPAAHGVVATALTGKALQKEADGAPQAEIDALWIEVAAERVDPKRCLGMLQGAPCCTAPAFVSALNRRLAQSQ
jgi:tetratricopeptide (TPR) repeat protein